MNVHLVDGTYELFRHFYGLRRFSKGQDPPYGAVVGVLQTLLQMIEQGATHLGVATDHVIESFRNRMWPGYKTGQGIERALRAQFHPLEDAIASMGVVVWPMIELEADDALASAARLASEDPRVDRVCIWTPDKDLAQCVRDPRVVQVDRKSKTIRDEAGVRAKFGVEPALIPDLLALVGDAADGYPGLAGIGAVTAARMLNLHGPIENFPQGLLGDRREQALLFKKLATLKTDAALFRDVKALEWRGPIPDFLSWSERIGAPRLFERCMAARPAMGVLCVALLCATQVPPVSAQRSPFARPDPVSFNESTSSLVSSLLCGRKADTALAGNNESVVFDARGADEPRTQVASVVASVSVR